MFLIRKNKTTAYEQINLLISFGTYIKIMKYSVKNSIHNQRHINLLKLIDFITKSAYFANH